MAVRGSIPLHGKIGVQEMTSLKDPLHWLWLWFTFSLILFP